MNKWQPISTCPTDGTPVDLWVDRLDGRGERWPDMTYIPGGGPGDPPSFDGDMISLPTDAMIDWDQITHWMPIPKGPNGEDPST